MIYATAHPKTIYIPGRGHARSSHNRNAFLGVAFEIEKPMGALIKSFWKVLTSPVEINRRAPIR